MVMKEKIGVVGYGVVGEAIASVFSDKGHKVLVNDIKPLDFSESKETLMKGCDFVFLCLPTPTNGEGCDISALEDTFDEIGQCRSGAIVVVKSTVPPGTTRKFAKEYPHLNIVYSPEFLTEANAKEDFKDPDRVVLAGEEEHRRKVRKLFQDFDTEFVTHDDYKTAEMSKYASNLLLATKVSFANQMKILCDELDIDSKEVMDVVTRDSRISQHHLDPLLGPFEGMCLPKDLRAMIFHGNNHLDVNISLLESVHEINEHVKSELSSVERKIPALAEN